MDNSVHLTLSQLNGIIQSKLNEAFFMQQFWIVADITEYSFKEKSGYHYFEFVEKDFRTNLIVAKIKWQLGEMLLRESKILKRTADENSPITFRFLQK